jgi:hypothetical protein
MVTIRGAKIVADTAAAYFANTGTGNERLMLANCFLYAGTNSIAAPSSGSKVQLVSGVSANKDEDNTTITLIGTLDVEPTFAAF